MLCPDMAGWDAADASAGLFCTSIASFADMKLGLRVVK